MKASNRQSESAAAQNRKGLREAESQASMPPIGHRVDAAHPRVTGKPKVILAPNSSDDSIDEPHAVTDESDAVDASAGIREMDASAERASRLESLLPEHSAELIRELQSWSDALDRREAELNARTALVEHQERALRLRDLAQATEHSEQDRSIERRRRELQDEMRRVQVGNIQLP